MELMQEPVVDKEGNSYEKAAISQWIQTHGTSPITRSPLSVADLAPNRALRDAIAAFLLTHPQPILPQMAPPERKAYPPDEVLTLEAFSLRDGRLFLKLQPPDSLVRTAVDITCIIDVSGKLTPLQNILFNYFSGSMAEKISIPGGEATSFSVLDIVVHAVKTVIKSLTPQDRLSIVSFTNTAQVDFELAEMTPHGQERAIEKLEQLIPLNSTNIWAGLDAAMTVMESRREKGRHASFFLLTDGVPSMYSLW